MEVLSPRESARYIANVSQEVSVMESEMPLAAEKVFARMKRKKYSPAIWKEWPLHPQTADSKSVDWIFVIDSLNFSFWLPSNEPQFQVRYKEKTFQDYEALCASINRALQEGLAITTPSYYKDVSLETIEHVFRSCNDTTLPLLKERAENLRQTGQVLCQHFQGSFVNVVKAASGDVTRLIDIVTRLFPCFNDVGVFEGRPVQFQKRVQILIADIWACFEGESYGEFHNIHELTMFPDYRVPQALLALKVIKYTSRLMAMVKSETLLPHGERDEMEIRGCSMHAVELLRHAISKLLENEIDDEKSGLHEKIMNVNSVLLDFYLWDYATEHPKLMSEFPEHRTRSIYY